MCVSWLFFFVKQKTAYEMRISDWSSDVCSSDLGTGAVVSETPCGTAPSKWRFLARNRLIAALSDATVVVEAGVRSGSLNTAAHAAYLGRALGAVPGQLGRASGRESVSVRVDSGGSRSLKKKTKKIYNRSQ